MAYNVYLAPKTDWDASKGVAALDFNRIEGNTLALLLNARESNRLINGGFDIWQRGVTKAISTSGPTQTLFLADRWQHIINGATTRGTISKSAFTAGQASVPGNPVAALKQQITAHNSDMTINRLCQTIENVANYSGKKVTISFYALADIERTISVYMTQNFGTSGSPAVNTASQNITVTNTWQKFTLTFNLSSISGKTIGTANTHFVSLSFGLPINTLSSISIAQCKLEEGEIATPFVSKGYTRELLDCLRYYEAISISGCAVAGGLNIRPNCGVSTINYMVKRVVPVPYVDFHALTAMDEEEIEWALTAVNWFKVGTCAAFLYYYVGDYDFYAGEGAVIFGTSGSITVDAELYG